MAFHVRKATKIIPHFRNGMRFLGSLRETPFAVHKIGNRVLGFENMLNHLSTHRFKSTKVEKQIDSVNDDRDNQVLNFPGGKVKFTPQLSFVPEREEERVPCFRVLDDNGQPSMYSNFTQVSKEIAMKMYNDMVTLQTMDTIFYEAQRQGRISFYVTSLGEEAINIASAAALSLDDLIVPQFSNPPCRWCCIFNEDGKKRCLCSHLFWRWRNERGRFPRSFKFCSSFGGDGVVVKGRAYGVRSIRVDGNDALAVYNTVRAARKMAIQERRPILIEALTYRVGHHTTSDDSTRYRPVEEMEWWRVAKDPVSRFRKWIESNGWWSDEAEAELRSSLRKQLLEEIQLAERTEKPPVADAFTDVYDVPPSNLEEQERWLRKTIKTHPQDYPSDFQLL